MNLWMTCSMIWTRCSKRVKMNEVLLHSQCSIDPNYFSVDHRIVYNFRNQTSKLKKRGEERIFKNVTTSSFSTNLGRLSQTLGKRNQCSQLHTRRFRQASKHWGVKCSFQLQWLKKKMSKNGKRTWCNGANSDAEGSKLSVSKEVA